MMNAVFNMNVTPFNDRLDRIAMIVANPIAKEALEKGGTVVQIRAEELVHRLTGVLMRDIVVVTRARSDGPAKYVLIGPGWDPGNYRRVAPRRMAHGMDVRPDQTTNPGIYGYFLEVGHRSPGEGLAHNAAFKRDSARARKQGKKLNTYTDPSSRAYGNLSTPPYPWLEPAFEQTKDHAVEVIADTIRERLAALGI
jgi:hypothetical protein